MEEDDESGSRGHLRETTKPLMSASVVSVWHVDIRLPSPTRQYLTTTTNRKDRVGSVHMTS